MAIADSVFLGEQNPFEGQERQITVAEINTQTVTMVGEFGKLVGLVGQGLRPGSQLPDGINYVRISGGSPFVRDFAIRKTEGLMAQLTISCVEASDPAQPYQQTIDVDIAQVEKKLINHPSLKGQSTQFQIMCFEKTEENLRFDGGGTPQSMFDLNTGEPLDAPVSLTNRDAIRYAKAVLIGVDTYAVYLPVVTRVSQYIKLPGVNVSASSVSGTIRADNIDSLGDIDTPPVGVSGFSGGYWLKTGDHFVQNAVGSWTRTESWTYTNDSRTKWIYQNGAAKELVS